MERKMNFISIVPFFPGNIAYMAREARRAAERTGVRKYAYCMTLVPATADIMAMPRYYAEAFRQLRDELAADDLEVGILVQALVGHGWNGARKAEVPMQFAINITGKTKYRHCMLDPRFRQYVKDVMTILARQKPDFFLLDDDIRMINNSADGAECFCPLHMELYNRRMSRHFTESELREYLLKASPEDEVVRIFEEEREKLLLDFAGDVRRAIDSVNPDIACGACAGGGEYLMLGKIARALAGKKPSFLRIHDAGYLEGDYRHFPVQMYHAALFSHLAGRVDSILDESDTCPHSRFSKSATTMHAHICGGILNGLSGGKLWITDLRNAHPENSDGFERILGKYRRFYDVLLNEVSRVAWQGAMTPLVDVQRNFNPARAKTGFYSWREWQLQMLNFDGIPARYGTLDQEGTVLLTGDVVEYMDDGELRQVLSRRALVDGYAALRIAERGMAKEYLGCVPRVEEYRTSGEYPRFNDHVMTFHNDFSLPKLTSLRPGVEILTDCSMEFLDGSGRREVVAPGTICYDNPAGGRVVTCAIAVGQDVYNINGPWRKAWLKFLLAKLDAANIPVVAQIDQPVYLRCGKYADGSLLAALLNMSYDPMPEIALETARTVQMVQALDADGEWRAVPFRHTTAGIAVEYPLACQELAVLRLQ